MFNLAFHSIEIRKFLSFASVRFSLSKLTHMIHFLMPLSKSKVIEEQISLDFFSFFFLFTKIGVDGKEKI